MRRRLWQPTPVLLPGKSHGWRSLVGCSPWGSKESDTTERLHFHFSLSCIEEGNGNPLQCSCLENPRDGGAWWAAVNGVAQSRTRLKWLSSSSSSSSNDQWCWASFHVLLGYLYIFLGVISIHVLCLFLNQVAFLLLSFKSSLYTLYINALKINDLPIYSPVLLFSFLLLFWLLMHTVLKFSWGIICLLFLLLLMSLMS